MSLLLWQCQSWENITLRVSTEANWFLQFTHVLIEWVQIWRDDVISLPAADKVTRRFPIMCLALQLPQRPEPFLGEVWERCHDQAPAVRTAIIFISLPAVIKFLQAMVINVSHGSAEDCTPELILYVKQCSLRFYGSVLFAHPVWARSHVNLFRPACQRQTAQ